MAREVLKNLPENIYEFLGDYVEARLRERDKGMPFTGAGKKDGTVEDYYRRQGDMGESQTDMTGPPVTSKAKGLEDGRSQPISGAGEGVGPAATGVKIPGLGGSRAGGTGAEGAEYDEDSGAPLGSQGMSSVSNVSNFIDQHLGAIRRLLTGEASPEEARGTMMTLAISLIVGIVLGYAIKTAQDGSFGGGGILDGFGRSDIGGGRRASCGLGSASYCPDLRNIMLRPIRK